MARQPGIRLALTAFGALLVLAAPAQGKKKIEAEAVYTCAQIMETPFVVWYGNDATMTAERLAAYCAPILWFSPDEPLLEDRTGKDITIPEAFPFEANTGRPVVYSACARCWNAVTGPDRPSSRAARTGPRPCSTWTISPA
ncbi:MAG: hypothetical protein OEO21_05985 [Candidatus Krumholzibacteria bacterium]|nr:hypothetical protein [Candidatus Krumholzibacteria bacterium]